ncbi:isoprenylcysteine carboxylmethyltransferase family protein, partial [Pseudomonas sp. SIMBA_059]
MAVEPDSAGVRLPPPFIYLGALLLGLAADRFVALSYFGIDRWLLIATGAL